MKKILLISIAAIIEVLSFGQASCPVISNFVVSFQGPALYKIDFDFKNPTSGNKNILVEATCNGSSIAGFPFCQDAKNDGHYSSGVIVCNNLATLIVTLTPYTGNNCGGAACGPSQRSIGGSPLPVSFSSFTAGRDHSSVVLRWETAWEQNSSGFAVERNIDGNWQQVTFVGSQAPGGNSSDLLSYQYIDVNNSKGISQYRLRQVDFHMQSKYSNVVAVRGENQPGKIIVYPNPSGGTVNIVFETADVSRDISLTDMAGRIISQWRGLTVNTMKIDNLKGGLYLLRVISIETGEQQVEKIVVAK